MKRANLDCQRAISPEQTIFSVLVIYGDGHQSRAPTCCDVCAKKVKSLYRNVHLQNADTIESEKPKPIMAKDFLDSFYDRNFLKSKIV